MKRDTPEHLFGCWPIWPSGSNLDRGSNPRRPLRGGTADCEGSIRIEVYAAPAAPNSVGQIAQMREIGNTPIPGIWVHRPISQYPEWGCKPMRFRNRAACALGTRANGSV